MKKMGRFLAVLVLYAWVVPQAVTAGEAKTVLLLEDPWPPYTLGEEGSAPTGGIAVELLREIFNRLNVPVEFKLQPWKRVLRNAEEGEADGIMLLMYEAERERFLAYSDVIFESRELLYFRRDLHENFQWNSFADLRNYTFGVVDGYTYSDEFLEAIKTQGLKTDPSMTTDMNWRKLYGKRIDFMVEGEAIANALFAGHKEYKEAFRAAARPVSTFALHMAFSKKSEAAALLPEVNRIIAEIQKDGTVDRILGRSE